MAKEAEGNLDWRASRTMFVWICASSEEREASVNVRGVLEVIVERSRE